MRLWPRRRERNFRLRVLNHEGVTILNIDAESALLLQRYIGGGAMPFDLNNATTWYLRVDRA